MSRAPSRIVGVVAVLASVAVACSSGAPSPPTGGPSLEVGDEAPGFTLPDAGGGSVSLADFRGHRPVLLYFSMGPG